LIGLPALLIAASICDARQDSTRGAARVGSITRFIQPTKLKVRT
jgi:hypothetical protein